jgi:hypothetical protein
LKQWGGANLVTAVSGSGCELDSKRIKEGNIVMGAARGRRGKWRGAKSKRKLPKTSKEPGRWRAKHSQHHEPLNGESTDRLVLSALNYWEVKRDLIEERLATIRSATATS